MTVSDKKLVLNSHGGNYSDYYDHHFESPYFCPPGTPTWVRNSRSFPLREESFRELERASIPTPRWGKVSALADELIELEQPPVQVVVYTDESYHQGMGKELCGLDFALHAYPNLLACEYIPPFSSEFKGISRRWLMIGESAWTLEYRSTSDWRSNVGEVEIDVLGPLEDKILKSKLIQLMVQYKSPIFAIDVVPARGDLWLATDLNLAPGMHNSGIKEFVPPAKAASLVKEFYHEYCL